MGDMSEQDKNRAEFDAWVTAQGLIRNAFGITAEQTGIDIARWAWQASAARSYARIAELEADVVCKRGEIGVLMSILRDCRYPLLVAKADAEICGEQDDLENLARLIRTIDQAMKGGA
jgi:hypothetical protein